MAERLHATNRHGHYVKTDARPKLFEEIRKYSRKHGDAHLALPVINVILMHSNGEIRLVKRGDRPENPFMWDKSVGGHVVTEDRSLSRAAFDENARKEMMEEVGVGHVTIADDDLHYHTLLKSDSHQPGQRALIRMIDHDPWHGSLVRVRNGEPWLKRSNVVVYAGVFDGPFQFLDGEAVDHRAMTLRALKDDVEENPWRYADGVRILMQRYFYLLKTH
ncbi:MAG: NUDIX domain-containing protein [Magnetococcales bacterium]|nr:NUDIX domain-containing protein [Magnetococcales bacterium]